MEIYKTTKAIRFKLSVNKDNDLRNHIPENQELNLSQLGKLGFEIINQVENYIWFEKKDKVSEKPQTAMQIAFAKANIATNINQKIAKELSKANSIKTNFLTNFCKRDFYEWIGNEKPKKQYSLSKLKFLDEKLKNVIQNINQKLEIITNYADKRTRKEHHNLERKKEINLLVIELENKQHFKFIKSFVENLILKNQSKDELDSLLKEFEKELKIATDYYRPSQSSGLIIAKASFNYYTLNKNNKDLKIEENIKGELIKLEKQRTQENLPQEFTNIDFADLEKSKECTEKQQQEKFDKVSTLLANFIRYVNIGSKSNQPFSYDLSLKMKNDPNIKFHQEKENLSNYELMYMLMKLYKAKAKALFIAGISKKENLNMSFEDLQQNYPLFVVNNKEDFTTFKKWNEKVVKQTSDDKATTERGKYFQKDGIYQQFVKKYTSISKKYGELKSKLAGIDKEKVESQLLQYWALILQEKEQHKLVLIHREKAKSFKEKVEKLPPATNESPQLIYFESLTYRSLQKLCFGNSDTSTFAPEIKKEMNVPIGEYEFQGNEQQKICFYKTVLQTDHARKVLNLDWSKIDDDIIKPHFEKLDDFKIALEKVTYNKHVKIPEDINLFKDNNALFFDIVSQDLNLKQENKEYHKNKKHTEIWNNFWSDDKNNNYNIRLNPEIAISYRQAKPSRIDKYQDGIVNGKQMRNRYLGEQFTLITTISENCLSKENNLSFKTNKDLTDYIVDFNTQFNNKCQNVQYSLGIDVGTKDLAYATLIGKSDKHNLGYLPKTFTAYELIKLDYAKPNINSKEYKAINNLSYFLNENLYNKSFADNKFQECFNEIFKEKQLSSFDLTISKVIDGKLIVNGDYHALLNLKILHAKRQIYQSLIENIKQEFSDDFFRGIYAHRNEFENISFLKKDDIRIVATIENIKHELEDYFQEQKQIRQSDDNKEKEDKLLESYINKARNALVANMIGVIDFIRKQYQCYIVLEDLNQSVIESHRTEFNGDITRFLEFKLYQKMQNYGFVPPIKGIAELREREGKKLKQVGIVRFVDEEETSLICPNCGKKAYSKSDDYVYNSDKGKGIFKCKKYEILNFTKQTEEIIHTGKYYPKDIHKPCEYHNRDNQMQFSDLITNDAIAAFNIAKRGFENFLKQQ
ncbi:hypothetical protein FACS1894180_0100 [Bacteroidia bacterium]|nr:hypothetical protein FACS1894180_0100 [Bacteroidia bacterium]